MSIAVRNLSKTYGGGRTRTISALSGVDLEVKDAELVVVVGPSGSGKSTLLRCIAGLEEPDAGRVEVGGTDVTDVTVGARDVAMVFQEYALYPHMSVRANIGFGLRARKVPPADIDTKVTDASLLLGIEDTLDRRPNELSGGERQRVALARAIVREPKAFLLDEPLSNLDAEFRAYMRAELRGLQRSLATTALYVTHDQIEALTMGDRVAVLRDGKIEQFDTPAKIYDHPTNTFVARFIGTPPMNVAPASLFGDGLEGFVGIRPEHLQIISGGKGKLTGRVVHQDELGHEVVVHVAVGDEVLLARADRERAPALHSPAELTYETWHLYRFTADGHAAQ